MRHTKGPWKILYSSNSYPSIHAGEKNAAICVLYGYTSGSSRDLLDNSDANAQLIAAAPEMLEALERTLKKLKALSIEDASLIGEITEIEESLQYTLDKVRG